MVNDILSHFFTMSALPSQQFHCLLLVAPLFNHPVMMSLFLWHK